MVMDTESKKTIPAIIDLLDPTDHVSFMKIKVDSSGQFLLELPLLDSLGILMNSPYHEIYNKTISSSFFNTEASPTQYFYLNAVKNKFTQTFTNVLFSNNSAQLLPGAEKELDQLVTYLIGQPSSTILIEGHTDNIGAALKNKNLSLNRAKTIAQYLISHHILASRISTIGYGDTKPIASNDNEQDRQKNRRTSFTITTSK